MDFQRACIRSKGVKPIPKGGDQLVVGVTREDEQRLEHGLPCCFGIAAQSLEVGPAGGPEGVGLAMAVPDYWKGVGSCGVAQVREVSHSHVQLLLAGRLRLLSHHDLIDGQVRGPS